MQSLVRNANASTRTAPDTSGYATVDNAALSKLDHKLMKAVQESSMNVTEVKKQIEDMLKYEMIGRYSSLGATIASDKGKKKGGPGSTVSRKSSLAGRSSLSVTADKRAEKEENYNSRQAASPGLRKKKQRSDSEKQRAMEKKLLLYYQSLVKPVEEWVRDVDPE